MEDFTLWGIVGVCFGVLIAIITIIILYNMSGPKISGSYLTYENVIYKKVSEEELENIIVLEMK